MRRCIAAITARDRILRAEADQQPDYRTPEVRRVIEEGKPAPDFELESEEGATVRLSELRGKPVVIYFYPKDDTPGCTKQACGFRDAYDEYRERGAVVLGVSPDDTASHRKFKEKYRLPFTLLADPGHEVADRYGAWGER